MNVWCKSFILKNVQNEYEWEEREMQCLLQVVKWLTKCLFYSWLLKICTGLSLLFSSFVRDVFCKCSYFRPCGLQLSPHASNTGSSGRCVCLEAKTGAHTTNSDAIFLSSKSALFIRETSINVSLLQGIFSKKTVAFIQPYVVGLRERWQAGSEELPLVSRFRHAALPPRVKWLLFLHEHFSSSHRNKKPYYTVAYTQRIQGGGSSHFSQYYLRGKSKKKRG